MLHLIKLAAGVRDFDQLAALVAARAAGGGPISLLTRNLPKRSDEILQGGSLYWVAGGAVVGRQRVTDIAEDAYADGTRCARIELAPELVRVAAQACRPFQGWRYYEREKAPADILGGPPAEGLEALPHTLRSALAELCLI